MFTVVIFIITQIHTHIYKHTHTHTYEHTCIYNDDSLNVIPDRIFKQTMVLFTEQYYLPNKDGMNNKYSQHSEFQRDYQDECHI